MLKQVTPREAAQLMSEGALLVDIREADERAREKAAGSAHHPLSRIAADGPARTAGRPVIFHCRSGGRTGCNIPALAEAAGGEAYVLEGGLEAWKAAGLPVDVDRRQPIEIMRQVQIAAGGLVVVGAVLGLLVHPAFYALSAAVGAGLVFAGVSGTCMMANMLRAMPWNRTVAAGAA
jgi:rhodanese-related sulfurtransferase